MHAQISDVAGRRRGGCPTYGGVQAHAPDHRRAQARIEARSAGRSGPNCNARKEERPRRRATS
jgi:hypothetical protein